MKNPPILRLLIHFYFYKHFAPLASAAIETFETTKKVGTHNDTYPYQHIVEHALLAS